MASSLKKNIQKINNISIAMETISGKAPGIMWLGGYGSDMTGIKASAIAEYAEEKNLSFLRYDYSGHGQSEGVFSKGTISSWLEESLILFNQIAHHPCILIGSSMGAWIALRIAQELQKEKKEELLAAMILLAPAPDFTQDLIQSSFTEEQKQILDEKGSIEIPSSLGMAVYTKNLIEDGKKNLVLTEPLSIHCPIHIIHGTCDKEVPLQHALKLAYYLPKSDLTLSFIPGGDHRLSRPQDIDRIKAALQNLIDPQH